MLLIKILSDSWSIIAIAGDLDRPSMLFSCILGKK